MQPRDAAEALAQMLKVTYDGYRFLSEAHRSCVRWRRTSGVYLAGACQAPKKGYSRRRWLSRERRRGQRVSALFSVEEMGASRPFRGSKGAPASVDCERVRSFGAISAQGDRDRQGNLVLVSHVNAGVCAGCGACVTTCRSGSADLAGFSDEQVMAQIALWSRL